MAMAVSFSLARRSEASSPSRSAFAFLGRRCLASVSAVVSKGRMTLWRSASFESTGTERARWREEPVSAAGGGRPWPPTPASASAQEPWARAPSTARAVLAQEGNGREPPYSDLERDGHVREGEEEHCGGRVRRSWQRTRRSLSSRQCPAWAFGGGFEGSGCRCS